MKKVKTIITTDVEVDDMNSLIHLCLYLNEINLLGVIYTSSQYHFVGDGTHTLGEVTPNFRCSGNAGLKRPRTWFTTDPEAKNLKEFRPFELGWIENLWKNQYAQAYENLIKHDKSFPSPDHLLSITKYGNIEFEGDVRFDTEGSNMIKDILLNDDPDPVYIQSWGGVNTIVRALLSIHEEYHNTDKWHDIYEKVVSKTRLLGVFDFVGQDNSYLDNRINELYPDLIIMNPEDLYGTYYYSLTADESLRDLLQAEWMHHNIHVGNGPLMSEYHLFGDGKYVKGEPDIYQFGINSTLDFGKPGFPPVKFDKYTFLAEGDSNTYIPLISFGLRGLENPSYGTLLGRMNVNGSLRSEMKKSPFIKSYHEDFAARAKWCVSDYEHANHATVVSLKEYDICAQPGQTVLLAAEVTDPDGDKVITSWEYYPQFTCYHGKMDGVLNKNGLEAEFTVPSDAVSGDWFSVFLRAKDNSVTPMTSYGHAVIHVK